MAILFLAAFQFADFETHGVVVTLDADDESGNDITVFVSRGGITQTLVIDVTPVNDAATASSSIEFDSDASGKITFDADTFGFDDPDGDVSGIKIKITDLSGVTGGASLQFDDGSGASDVRVDDEISYANISNLTLNHDNSAADFTFGFRVIDDQGLENTTDYTVTLDVL